MSRWVSLASLGKVQRRAPVLLLLPVGQKHADLTLCPLVAAKKEMPGMSAGGQQIRKTCLLSGGEELGVGGDAPVPGQLQLVQSTGKQYPFLAVPGAFVQKFGFGHGFTPYLA